jgi:DNA repair exonuclease SbcCD ATPase subunit
MATLEDRVTKLEQDVQEIRSDIKAGLQAQAFGLSLVQSEAHELRGEVGELRAEMQARFTGVEEALAQILERLNR